MLILQLSFALVLRRRTLFPARFPATRWFTTYERCSSRLPRSEAVPVPHTLTPKTIGFRLY